jgi:hypothetical protein
MTINPSVQNDEEQSCQSTFYQKETVCVPVHVTPYATPGKATAVCCNKPLVTEGDVCTGGATSCSFTITQELCISVPVSFGADIETGDAVVECGTLRHITFSRK